MARKRRSLSTLIQAFLKQGFNREAAFRCACDELKRNFHPQPHNPQSWKDVYFAEVNPKTPRPPKHHHANIQISKTCRENASTATSPTAGVQGGDVPRPNHGLESAVAGRQRKRRNPLSSRIQSPAGKSLGCDNVLTREDSTGRSDRLIRVTA